MGGGIIILNQIISSELFVYCFLLGPIIFLFLKKWRMLATNCVILGLYYIISIFTFDTSSKTMLVPFVVGIIIFNLISIIFVLKWLFTKLVRNKNNV